MNGVLNKKDIVQHRILPNTKSATNRENKKATKHLKEKNCVWWEKLKTIREIKSRKTPKKKQQQKNGQSEIDREILIKLTGKNERGKSIIKSIK
jgi:hypothetical protein